MNKKVLISIIAASLPCIAQAETLQQVLAQNGLVAAGTAPAGSSASPSKVYWNGGTRVEFPQDGFTFQINTQVQSRYTFTDNDDSSDKGNTSSFEMKRVRINVKGSALHDEFEYAIQTDFVGAKDENGVKTPNVRDAYIKWNVCDDAFLKMGQYKVGISRQYNGSSAKMQFADRSAASEYFDLGRQNGLQGGVDLGGADLTAAIFNGESSGEGMNLPGVDRKHTGVVTVRSDVMGKMDAAEEGDIKSTSELALNLGAAYAFSEYTTGGPDGDVDAHIVSVDANLKQGGLGVHGEFFLRDENPDEGDGATPVGFYAQAGYFLTPKELELAGRFAMVDCDSGAAGGDCSGADNLDQATVGLNYYFAGHNLKAQLNYDFLRKEGLDDGDDVDTNRWLLQLSSYL